MRSGSLLATMPLVAAAFNPATLSLSGWWRAAYAGAPWAGTASAGSSGSRNLTAGTAPAVGATLNGLAGADWNGSTHVLTTSLAGTSILAAAGFSFWILMRADAAPADPGAGSRWQGAGFWDDSGATYVQATITTAGASLYVTSGGAGDEVTATCSTGAEHLIQGSFDGNNLTIQVDSAAKVTQATTNGPGTTVDDLTSTIRIGRGQQFFDGRIWDIGFRQAPASDADRTNIRSYINSRYALAL